MSDGAADEVRSLLAASRRDDARRLLRDRDAPAVDPAELGAEAISLPDEGPEEGVEGLEAWALPAELGGGAVLACDDAPGPRRLTLVDPDDTLVLSFGGIGAAVGSVPITVHRRSADGQTDGVAFLTVEVGPGSYGDPDPGEPTPEEVADRTARLLDAVDEAAGCAWIRFGDLEKEEWNRAAFLERYNALADAAGVEPLDGETVDRENHWVRYGGSPRYLSVDAYARAVFEARSGEGGSSRDSG